MLLTIITCCKDDYSNLADTIESLLLLKNKYIEIIIWDATKSPKEIRTIIPNINKLNNISIETMVDRGLYDGINRAISKSSGEYISIINAGDRVLQNYEKILNDIALKNISGEEKPDIYANPVITWKNKFIYPSSDMTNFVHQGLIYKKLLHDKFGEYLVSKGFTASDYLFFFGQIDQHSISINFGLNPIAFYQRPGLSSSAIHFLQRDIILGSKMKKKSWWFLSKFIVTILRFHMANIYNKVIYR